MHRSSVYNVGIFFILSRDRMLLMKRSVYLTRFLFTIASFFFHSRDVARLMRHISDLPFIFHGRISRVRCPLGQVRLRVSCDLHVCFVSIYFHLLFAKCDITAHSYLFRWLFFRWWITIWSTVPPYFIFVLYSLLRLSCLVIFYYSKLYFLIPLFLPHQRGWLPPRVTRIK